MIYDKKEDKEKKRGEAKAQHLPPPKAEVPDLKITPTHQLAPESEEQADEVEPLPPLPNDGGAAPEVEPAPAQVMPASGGDTPAVEPAKEEDSLLSLTKEQQQDTAFLNRLASIYDKHDDLAEVSAENVKKFASSLAQERARFVDASSYDDVSKFEKLALAATGGFSGVLFGTYGKMRDVKERREVAGRYFDALAEKRMATNEALVRAWWESMSGESKSLSDSQRLSVRTSAKSVANFVQNGGSIRDIDSRFTFLNREQSIAENFDRIRLEAEDASNPDPSKQINQLAMLGSAADGISEELTADFAAYTSGASAAIGNIITKFGDKANIENVMQAAVDTGQLDPLNRRQVSHFRKTYYSEALKLAVSKHGASFDMDMNLVKAYASSGKGMPTIPPNRYTKHELSLLNKEYDANKVPADKVTEDAQKKRQAVEAETALLNHYVSGGVGDPVRPQNISEEAWAEGKANFNKKVANFNWDKMVAKDQSILAAESSIAEAEGALAFHSGGVNPHEANTPKGRAWKRGNTEEAVKTAAAESSQTKAENRVSQTYSTALSSLYVNTHGVSKDDATIAVSPFLKNESAAREELERLKRLRAAQAGFRSAVGTLKNPDASLQELGLTDMPKGNLLKVSGGSAFTEPAAVDAMTALIRANLTKQKAKTIIESYNDGDYGKFFKFKDTTDPTTGSFKRRTWVFTEAGHGLNREQRIKIANKAAEMLEQEQQIVKNYRYFDRETDTQEDMKRREALLKKPNRTDAENDELKVIEKKLETIGVPLPPDEKAYWPNEAFAPAKVISVPSGDEVDGVEDIDVSLGNGEYTLQDGSKVLIIIRKDGSYNVHPVGGK